MTETNFKIFIGIFLILEVVLYVIGYYLLRRLNKSQLKKINNLESETGISVGKNCSKINLFGISVLLLIIFQAVGFAIYIF